LNRAGHDVFLIVADGKGDECREGVKIYDVGTPGGRLNRVFHTTRRVLAKAIAIDAMVYHFHDPELIPVGLKLKRMGKRVVLDAHEDVPKQLLSKPYLTKSLRHPMSWAFSVYEKMTCGRFDAIVAATPFIQNKFLEINENSINVNNFPLSGELSAPACSNGNRLNICYVGGISEIRGARQIVRAMALIRSCARLELAGCFAEAEVYREVCQDKGWAKVDELGFVDRAGVRDILGRSFAGLVTFLPAPNHIDAQPNKMFEYMSSGTPVIASDFPLWREIIEGNDCGLCIDPENPAEIAKAIDYLADNPDRARQMGENGKRAVQNLYNWDVEEKKLLYLYNTILNS
jgi:glycosyltransferase involved in cell wall biosynthesis